MRETHLGELVAAYVDGELDPSARERAAAHLAGCEHCRTRVAAANGLKARLSALGDPPVPPDLTMRLLSMGERRRGPVGFRGTRRASRRTYRHPPRLSAPRLALAGAASVVVAGLATALVVGGTDQPAGPAVTPAIDRYVYEHAATTDEVPFANPGAGAAVSVTYAGVAGP